MLGVLLWMRLILLMRQLHPCQKSFVIVTWPLWMGFCSNKWIIMSRTHWLHLRMNWVQCWRICLSMKVCQRLTTVKIMLQPGFPHFILTMVSVNLSIDNQIPLFHHHDHHHHIRMMTIGPPAAKKVPGVAFSPKVEAVGILKRSWIRESHPCFPLCLHHKHTPLPMRRTIWWWQTVSRWRGGSSTTHKIGRALTAEGPRGQIHQICPN